MRFLLVNGPDLVDHALRLLETGHEVVFLYVQGKDTPFSYNVNFAQLERKRWPEFLNCFAETHNAYERHRHAYQERMFDDLDEIYAQLGDLENEFSPDHVIRAESDFNIRGIDLDITC